MFSLIQLMLKVLLLFFCSKLLSSSSRALVFFNDVIWVILYYKGVLHIHSSNFWAPNGIEENAE